MKKLIRPRKATLLKREATGLNSRGYPRAPKKRRIPGGQSFGEVPFGRRTAMDELMGIDEEIYLEHGVDVWEHTPDSFSDVFGDY